MGLTAGSHIGSYQVLAPLGAGGMGEVWRARDSKLGREVALKLLPDAFAEDPERLSRFRREAQLLASLNHPNIGAIHGLEESQGKPFLTLELVEGEDLAKRLARGALPREEALEIAKQIAEALEEAHAKGIVHRDLKPANVKITPEGRVKVLDFGLAKALGGETAAASSSAIDVSQSPTLARSGTLAGMVLGTAAYMAPEQASGKAVDRRADIWSFGVVLFEMLTGRPLFVGGTPSEILASVIKDEPSWDRLPADCPPAVSRLLRRCLRKRARERLQDIGDARVELGDILAGTTDEPPPGGPAAALAPGRGRGGLAWLPWTLALASTAAALVLGLRGGPAETGVPVRFAFDTPRAATLGDFTLPAFSPDGRHVVFTAGVAPGRTSLWIRPLGSPDARALPGTEGGMFPFWSPDGGSIAFFAPDGLKRLTLSDGSVHPVCAGPTQTAGGSWREDGTLLFSAGGHGARLYAVAATGGEPKVVSTPDAARKETAHWWPHFLPGGRRYLFTIGGTDPGTTGVFVSSLDSPEERRRVLPLETRAVHAPGHLLYVRDDVLEAQPFDEGRLETTGPAVVVARSVASWSQKENWGWFSVSPRGDLAYLSAGTLALYRLEWLDRTGGKRAALGEPARYGQIALSPDGRQVAAEIEDAKGRTDLWVLDVTRGVASRVTADPASEWDPVWSPVGRDLVFVSDRDGVKHLYRKSLEGSEPESRLRNSTTDEYPETWSPDGKTLLYLSEDVHFPRVGKTLWALSTEPGAKPTRLIKNGFDVDEPRVSPDSRWLAYATDDSGQWEVYVQAFARPGERVRVSTEGGSQPRWRGDGKELFYLARDGRLMAVAVRGGPTAVDVDLPTVLFDTGSFRPDYDDYASSADGQRFLVKVPVATDPQRIQIVLGWPAARAGAPPEGR